MTYCCLTSQRCHLGCRVFRCVQTEISAQAGSALLLYILQIFLKKHFQMKNIQITVTLFSVNKSQLVWLVNMLIGQLNLSSLGLEKECSLHSVFFFFFMFDNTCLSLLLSSGKGSSHSCKVSGQIMVSGRTVTFYYTCGIKLSHHNLLHYLSGEDPPTDNSDDGDTCIVCHNMT